MNVVTFPRMSFTSLSASRCSSSVLVSFFLAIPLPLLVYFLLPTAKPVRKQALKIPFFSQISQKSTLSLQKNKATLWPLILASIIWLNLVVAAAGPQWLGKAMPIQQSGRDILLAVDISGSMELPDMLINNQQVDRLTAIKIIASQFIQQRIGDRLGLIVFGSKAYLQTPLTFDRSTVEHMLQDTSIGLAGTQTAIGDAIGLAIKRLQNQPESQRLLILLTDGANNSGVTDPITAAKLAAKYKIRVYTIGFGAEELKIPGLFQTHIINPSMELDEKTLQTIAALTGGQYFRAKNTKSLQAIYQHLNKIEPIVSDQAFYRPEQPCYYWPLSIALLLSIAMACYKYRLIYIISKKYSQEQICSS